MGRDLCYCTDGETCWAITYTGRVALSPNKGKGKGVPVHAMKLYRGRRNIAPNILNLVIPGNRHGTDWTDCVISGPSLDILQNRKIHCPCRNSNTESSSPSPSHYICNTTPTPHYDRLGFSKLFLAFSKGFLVAMHNGIRWPAYNLKTSNSYTAHTLWQNK